MFEIIIIQQMKLFQMTVIQVWNLIVCLGKMKNSREC